MKIVFTAKGTDWDSEVDPRFGRTKVLVRYDEDTEKLDSVDNSEVVDQAHGVGPKTAQKLVEMEADVLITGNGPGGNAATVLAKTGVSIYTGAGDMTLKDAYDAYKKGALKKFQ